MRERESARVEGWGRAEEKRENLKQTALSTEPATDLDPMTPKS